MGSSCEGILGFEFIQQYDLDWNRRLGHVTLRGTQQRPKEWTSGKARSCRLITARETVVPPRSEVLCATVKNRWNLDDHSMEWGIAEATNRVTGKFGVMIGRSLVDPSREVIVVRLINPSKEEIVLPEGETVAVMSPVTKVSKDLSGSSQSEAMNCFREWKEKGEIGDCRQMKSGEAVAQAQAQVPKPSSTNGEVPRVSPHPNILDQMDRALNMADVPMQTVTTPGGSQVEIPEHLVAMFEQSLSYLTEDEIEKLAAFLCLQQDVWARHDDDLGRTDLVHHHIDTGDHKPIKQQARRVPLFKKQHVLDLVEAMLEKKVIEPCDGPWSSPIVLLSKKDG
jgi:hypothetical protein